MPTHDDNRRNLLQLCGKLRDGIISPEEFRQLESRLLNSRVERTTYRRFMGMCSALEQTARLKAPDTVQAVDTVQNSTANQKPAGSTPPLAKNADSARPHPARRRQNLKTPTYTRHRVVLVVVAAASMLVAVLVFGLVRRNSVGHANAFAKVTGVHQPVWVGNRSLKLDDGTPPGQYSLASGAVQFTYTNGAELLVQAPARFTLEDARRITLTTGLASLYIPPSANGFRIDTPFGSAIDHGTRFGVIANSETGIQLHVFEGKAELVAVGQSAGQMLSADEAASLDVDSTQIARIQPEENYFVRTLDDRSGLPQVTGNAEVRLSPPPSVRRVQADLVQPGRAMIFAERSAVVLRKDLPVTFLSGSATTLESNNAVLPAGNQVDSYLVHFVLPRNLWRSDRVLVAKGSVRFDKPIAAVIAHQPAKSGKLLGHPATDYPGDIDTGLEASVDSKSRQGDQVSISADRRTLTFHLQIHGNGHSPEQDRIDQLRILLDGTP